MPPVAKFSKEEIIVHAVSIIVNQGCEKLTARSLAQSLKTSVSPIFTAFANIEELKQCAFDYAFSIYHKQFESLEGKISFSKIGLIYISFAEKQSQLFKLLFMKFQEKKISFTDFMKKLDDNYEGTLSLIQNETGLSKDNAFLLYKNMWIYAHGIATLCATNQCKFTTEELEQMLEFTYKNYLEGLK